MKKDQKSTSGIPSAAADSTKKVSRRTGTSGRGGDTSAEANAASSQTLATDAMMQPLGQDGLAFEEEEAMTRSPNEDFQLFKKTCDEIRHCMKESLHCKKTKAEDKIPQLHVDGAMQFLVLKKLNRLDKYRSKKARDAVNEVKQKVDNFHLQLQNLLYEAMHLQKEVTKCLEFRSKDEEIDLIPVEEFYKEAPESMTRPKETRKDAHQLTLARLEWELKQREQLAVKLKETDDLKQVYKKEIEKKKECLENLQPTLKSILEATQPLHKELGMPLQAMHLEHSASEFLPRPLYVLYVQVLAYRRACDSKIAVSIEGNVEEAKALQAPSEDIDEESGESDLEDAGPVKRHRRSMTDQREEGQKKILKKHPLSVLLTVKHSNDIVLSVQFYYLMSLHIVTVKVKLGCQQQLHGIFASEVLSSNNLLHCLFPEDDGTESPNPANYFQLKNIGVENFSELIPQIGKPFRWCQRLTGLDFLPLGGSKEEGAFPSQAASNHAISSSFIELTIQAIKDRLAARVALYNQVSSLERGILSIPTHSTSFLTTKVSGHIKEFTKVTWEDFTAHPSAEEFLQLGMSGTAATVFQCILERGSARLNALVLVSAEYPKVAPLFLLTLVWKMERTSHTDASIFELEEEVNVRCVEMVPESEKNHVLSCQLQHLLVCFDVFLETDPSESTVEGPREFSQGKIVTRVARGRNHARPYKYLPKVGLFTHW